MLRPTGNKLVVRRDGLDAPGDVDASVFKKGLLVMPDIARAKSRYGIVVRVGPDVKERIRKGDRVVITWFDGTHFDDEDLGEVEVFLESEILAVVER